MNEKPCNYASTTPVRGIQIHHRFRLFLVYLGPTKNAQTIQYTADAAKKTFQVPLTLAVLENGVILLDAAGGVPAQTEFLGTLSTTGLQQ